MDGALYGERMNEHAWLALVALAHGLGLDYEKAADIVDALTEAETQLPARELGRLVVERAGRSIAALLVD